MAVTRPNPRGYDRLDGSRNPKRDQATRGGGPRESRAEGPQEHPLLASSAARLDHPEPQRTGSQFRFEPEVSSGRTGSQFGEGTREGTSTREAAALLPVPVQEGVDEKPQAETKQPVTERLRVDRHTCPCGNSWPASYGPKCHECNRKPSTAGHAAPVPGKYDGLFGDDDPLPDPSPLTPEVREELEALAVERDGYRKGPDGWVKAWM